MVVPNVNPADPSPARDDALVLARLPSPSLFPLFALDAGFLKGLTRSNPAQSLTLHSLRHSAPNLPSNR